MFVHLLEHETLTKMAHNFLVRTAIDKKINQTAKT